LFLVIRICCGLVGMGGGFLRYFEMLVVRLERGRRTYW